MKACRARAFTFSIKVLWRVTYWIWILKKSKREPAIIWKRVNCQRITSKNTRPQWVDTWARDMARWYWSADTLFWQLSIDDNIDVQSAFPWTPKRARKCESKPWYTRGADGRSVGHVITKFSGMVACSKRSDSGERCEVKKAMKSRGGLGREVRERL